MVIMYFHLIVTYLTLSDTPFVLIVFSNTEMCARSEVKIKHDDTHVSFTNAGSVVAFRGLDSKLLGIIILLLLLATTVGVIFRAIKL